MEMSDAGLREQPFRTQGSPVTVFPSSALRAALQFLADTYVHPDGLGLFQGPPLSGKSTILRHYVASLSDDMAWAIVDGAGTEPAAFLDGILRQFGYELQFSTVNELVNMLKVVILQQAGAGQPPLLVIENTQGMTPATLGILCDLVGLRVDDTSALKVVLASDRSMAVMVRAPAMRCVADRQTGSFFLEPMTADETGDYLYAKLHAAGSEKPQRIFPPAVCAELHEAASGWPGVVDRLALLALSKADKLPVTSKLIERPSVPEELPALLFRIDEEVEAATLAEAPTLIISHDGETIDELQMTSPRLLIGRSEHNDLRIASRYISRHHALFVRHGKTTFLMDLNSTNGTFVNSRRVSNLMMKHDDVVLIGNHRIKFVDPAATERLPMDDPTLSETLVMKSLEDVRRLLARENARVVESDDNQAAANGSS
jgi:general secretion pathway protein A